MEVANLLQLVDNNESTETFLKNALDHCVNGESLKIHCMNLLATNSMKSGDYIGALESYTEIHNILQTLPNNAEKAQLLLDCEINRVLLLLILKPPPQKLTSDLTQVLERYTWGDKNDESIKSEYCSFQIKYNLRTCSRNNKFVFRLSNG